VPPVVHEVLGSSGQPLEMRTRAFMEPRFGHDFGRVRVHTDARAAESAREVNALAYTVGSHLVFGTGQYRPGATEGTKLLAHELVHVVQQGGAGATPGNLTISQPHDQAEREADRMAAVITSAGTAVDWQPKTADGPRLSRSCGTCQAVDSEQDKEEKKPKHKGFTYEDVLAGEVKEEKNEEDVGGEAPQKPQGNSDSDQQYERPHAGAATITCESGDYVVKLNSWAGKPCGISDCVTVHESSHITDWRGRWPTGCKKADGTNQPDGYLPTGGDGYAAFLKTSECTAHTKDLECAEAKAKAATGDCKTKLDAYVTLTRNQKAGFC
jgi:hypothetical protein